MYICSDCGNEHIKWAGQCSFCKAWSTLKEFKETKVSGWAEVKKWEAKSLQNISNIKKDEKLEKIVTKSSELNSVLGWGIVPGGITLLTWEPGIWKSTITLQLGKWISDKKIIYISWEETEYQIWSRASRLGVSGDNMQLLAENNIENILETLSKNTCDILVIDSISVIHSSSIQGVAWSLSQVRYIAELLTVYGKKTNTNVFIIGHINKEWSIAWPKTLEHMVDTVLYFEWEKYDNLRILRSLKNRFWSTSEIWLFKMLESWLEDIKNPGLEFINNSEPTIGSSLSITMEWTRALIIETESLTTYTKFGYPKRSTRWINSSKLDLIVAVLWKYTWITLDSHDVYTNITRWLKIDEPWIDLSIAASIISSKINKALPKDTIFIWEISLTWIIKKPIHLEKRIKEAQKMWFKKIYCPNSPLTPPSKGGEKIWIKIINLKNISDLTKKINEL